LIELPEKGKITDKLSVGIILGSESDIETLKKSRMLEILDKVGIRYEVSVISAHRNPEILHKYCADAKEINRRVIFIGVAGMSAALPGMIATYVWDRPVIGVALSSSILNGQDAMYAMTRMPSGVPVAFAGIDKAGLENAAYLVCRIIAMWNAAVDDSFSRFIAAEAKPAKIGIISSKEKE